MALLISVETVIRYFDIKTSPVYFFVQRTSPIVTPNDATGGLVIPWQSARLNVGNAMNLTTGVFTAPHNGVYHFAFTAIKDNQYNFDTHIYLRLNGEIVGSAFATVQIFSTSALHSTLQLNKGDRIDLWLMRGGLFDDSTYHHTLFSGWMDEEDIQLL